MMLAHAWSAAGVRHFNIRAVPAEQGVYWSFRTIFTVSWLLWLAVFAVIVPPRLPEGQHFREYAGLLAVKSCI
jgi:hypothetical protein